MFTEKKLTFDEYVENNGIPLCEINWDIEGDYDAYSEEYEREAQRARLLREVTEDEADLMYNKYACDYR